MRLHYDGQTLELRSGETVLECIERHGLAVPSSCRSGVCQSCMLRASKGDVPEAAQVGLKPLRKAQGYFMSCVCRPTADLEVFQECAAPTFESTVVRAEPMADGVFGVWLRLPPGFDFQAGQFVQVIRPSDGVTRPYSLAALPEGQTLEIHIAVAPNGRMSGWLPAAVGEKILLKGPLGECTYSTEARDHTLLLAGTGTGLAPLLGVVRAALKAGHTAPVRLYHGARTVRGLYGRRVLKELQRAYPNLEVVYAVHEAESNSMTDPSVRQQSLEDAVMSDLTDCSRLQAYLCGNPDVVKTLRRQLYIAGVPLDRILSDAFVHAPAPLLH